MLTRTQREQLVFRHPFRLKGWYTDQPAGSYMVETEEELIEGLSFPAYRRVSTTLTRAVAGHTSGGEAIPVEPQELERLQQADQAPRPD